MAYDEELADRVRELIGSQRGVTEKRMFGGLAMFLNGNMAVVIRSAGGLLVRVDQREFAAAEAEPGATQMIMRGRTMRGWMAVASAGCATGRDLRRWVDRGVSCANSLPKK